jgi:addiction module RelE/StbE family toxin
MKMKINWQTLALQDLAAIYEYISIDTESAALMVTATIMELAQSQLPFFPRSGRVGRIAGTRELVVSKTPYIVVYEIIDEQINVLSILHTSQKWPKGF